MNWIAAIPIECRLAVLFVAGACLGALANWAAFRLSWEPRGTSPWIWDPLAPPRRWSDRLPILGWLGLRREASSLGRGFWIRPMVVELLGGAGLAALYWWEIECRGLLPEDLPAQLPPLVMCNLHAQWLCHAVLMWLMLVASLVDADEKLIPDAITVPGTLLGLFVASVYPFAMLPVVQRVQAGLVLAGFLNLASPHPWPAWLDGVPGVAPLALALGCWWLWCVALMHRTWYGRRGWRRALQLMWARLAREPSTWRLCLLGLGGSAVIGGTWWSGGISWRGLLTALVGMAASGAFVWLVRVVCSATLGREAMGFGDVTLMAMMGAYLGWQSCLVIFFLAPLAALVIGIAQWVLRRENEIPYGPFLCLAAVVLIVRWRAVWAWLEQTLGVLGMLVPILVVFCLVAMAGLLGLMRAFRGLRGGGPADRQPGQDQPPPSE